MNMHKYRNQKLFAYAKRGRWMLLAGFFFALLSVIFDLLAPATVARILDGLLVEGEKIANIREFLLLLGLFLLSVVSGAGFGYASSVSFQRAANRIAQWMQEELFAHVQTLPISYFDMLPAGKVVSRITNDTRDVRILFQVVLAHVTIATLYLTGIYGTLLLMDWKMFLMALIPVPFLLYLFADYRRKSTSFNKVHREKLSELNANLNENIGGMQILQAFGMQEQIYEEFSELNDAIYDQDIKLTQLESYSSFNAIGSLRYVSMAIVLLYFGWGWLTDAYPVTIGSLYLFINYMNLIYNQANNIIQRLGQLERAKVAADHIFTLLRTEGVPLTDAPEHLEGAVDFEDVSFYYQDEEYVLKDIRFHLEPGKTAAFVGHTGSGKSTIMNLLFGFYAPQHGTIKLDGKNLHELSLGGARDHMAIVLQDPYLFTGTILTNITLHDDRITEEMALQALLEVGGEEFLERHPLGIHTPITEKGMTFSAGERQLISFARALAKNPAILVLDEATSHVDSQTEQLIQAGIERLKQGRTTLLIAHRLSTIRDADTIFVLDKGRILEAGTHKELIELGGTYLEMYEHQSAASA
jgi:ATP-binding cassette subfamily B multidrug efflux pump